VKRPRWYGRSDEQITLFPPLLAPEVWGSHNSRVQITSEKSNPRYNFRSRYLNNREANGKSEDIPLLVMMEIANICEIGCAIKCKTPRRGVVAKPATAATNVGVQYTIGV